MGQIADDMIDGLTCSLCGCFFAEHEQEDDGLEAPLFEHGYPVVCWDCWEGLSNKDRKIHQRALRPTL